MDNDKVNFANKTVILVLGHLAKPATLRHFEKINNDCCEKYDVFYLADNSRGAFESYKSNGQFFLFDLEELEKLGYPGKSNIRYDNELQNEEQDYARERNFTMGNAELPLLSFFRQKPDYGYYWVVEYDVYYSGSWNDFFSYFGDSRSDLLTTSLIRYAETKTWFRWDSLRLIGKNVAQSEYVKGFFPIFRLSRGALRQLDQDYTSGVSGHHECLIPTLLNHGKYSLEDIGGDGEFVRSGNRNKFYTNSPQNDYHAPGTLVFRPELPRPGKQANMLWHPVKYEPFWRYAIYLLKNKLKHILIKTKLWPIYMFVFGKR